jgi:CMP/dCMP kinase
MRMTQSIAEIEEAFAEESAEDRDRRERLYREAEARARRRHAELKAFGLDVHYPDVLADIHARDERDRGRAAAPLVKAEDAILLDTSTLTVEAAVAAAIAAVEPVARARTSS